MTTGYTKGPWASASRQGSNWDLVVYKPGTSLEICQMFHDFTNGNEVGEANARLVAAAPELLSALEDLLDAIPKQTSDADWWPDELTRAVREAKAVIAKAEATNV